MPETCQEHIEMYPDTGEEKEATACIHNLNTYCRKYKHECDGTEDTNRCPEWQLIAELHALRKCLEMHRLDKAVTLISSVPP